MLVLFPAPQVTLMFWGLLAMEICVSVLMWILLGHRLVRPRAAQANENIQQSLSDFPTAWFHTRDFVSQCHGIISLLPEPIFKVTPSSNLKPESIESF